MDDWRQYRALNKKLAKLETKQRQQAARVDNWDDYSFTVSPTCPPSTSVVIRGGLCWLDAAGGEGWGWFADSYTVDLTDPAKVSTSTSYYGYTYTFTNPYWYAGCVIVLTGGLAPSTVGPGGGMFGLHPATFPDGGIKLAGTMHFVSEAWQEFDTAAKAEQAIQQMGMNRATGAGMVMAALVVRNNGTLTAPLQFMPIDAINRGRSYLFWDVRQPWQIE